MREKPSSCTKIAFSKNYVFKFRASLHTLTNIQEMALLIFYRLGGLFSKSITHISAQVLLFIVNY